MKGFDMHSISCCREGNHMGLFSKIRRQILTVIEWEDNTKDTIVYKYPLTDRDEIMNSSTLIVRPSQIALFVHKGQICDIFAPGTYKLSTENVPIITKLLSLPTGFDSPIKAEVYYINTKQMSGIKWGTTNPIMMRDADFGTVRLRAFGVFSFKVENAKKFMEEMFGTNQIYKTDDVCEHMKPMVLQAFADAVAESKISALDLAANYREFSQTIVDTSAEEFAKFGLKLCTLVIENISLPKEVEDALDERSKLGILDDKMGTYTQYQAANAMRDAAKNPNGNNMAGMGVGLSAGMTMGGMFGQTMMGVQPAQNKESNLGTGGAAASEATKECPECHSKISKSMKFCPECGAKQPVSKFCPHCGAKLDGTPKFCPECGGKL